MHLDKLRGKTYFRCNHNADERVSRFDWLGARSWASVPGGSGTDQGEAGGGNDYEPGYGSRLSKKHDVNTIWPRIDTNGHG